jgi:hypothetical protein
MAVSTATAANAKMLTTLVLRIVGVPPDALAV